MSGPEEKKSQTGSEKTSEEKKEALSFEETLNKNIQEFGKRLLENTQRGLEEQFRKNPEKMPGIKPEDFQFKVENIAFLYTLNDGTRQVHVLSTKIKFGEDEVSGPNPSQLYQMICETKRSMEARLLSMEIVQNVMGNMAAMLFGSKKDPKQPNVVGAILHNVGPAVLSEITDCQLRSKIGGDEKGKIFAPGFVPKPS